MKYLWLLTIITFGLTACGPYESVPRGARDKMNIKVLKIADEDTDTPKEFSLLCIDGVKYLMTNQGGITVKFQANQEGDPSAEECE